MNKTRMLLVTLASVALIGGGYGYWTTSREPSPAAKVVVPVPVTVASARLGELPVLLDIVGRAEAYESVTLKSRVDGQVAAVPYLEGQHVKQGDILIKLDPADLHARVLQAEANLAKDQAQQAKAKADVERYVALKARGFVSEEKVNDLRTAEAAAAATLKADQAALELARLQLSYATLRAPFAGVVGARLVFPGSAVKVNDTILAVVNRIQPLYVTFSVAEKYLPTLRQAMQTGPIKVLVKVPGDKEQSFEGSAKFIDNAVDASTGTIQIKAIVDNRAEKLTPGQFLNISLTLDKIRDVVLVPNEAVQQGAEGNFLYVAKPDNTVEPRKIEVLATYRGTVAIGQGVAAGESVVTDGQLRLTPGAAIQARPTAANTAQDTPSATADR